MFCLDTRLRYTCVDIYTWCLTFRFCIHTHAVPRDEGCPCLDDANQCETNLTPKQKACLNPNQKCKCGGDVDQGTCVPNFLPEGTLCSADDAGLPPLGDCEVATCTLNGAGIECVTSSAQLDTPCYAGGDPLCPKAGECALDGITGDPFCRELGCLDPDPGECTNAGDSCESESGTCCVGPSGILECNTDIKPPGGGTCPCFDDGATCVFDGVNTGFCCEKGAGQFECVESSEDCVQTPFCQSIPGNVNPNYGCSPSRSCGSGNADCAAICMQVNPGAACLTDGSNGFSCNCNGIGKGSNLNCDGPGTKCCECATPS